MSVPVLPGYKEPSGVTAVTLDSMEPSWQGGRDPRRIQFRLTMPVNPMLTMSLEHGAGLPRGFGRGMATMKKSVKVAVALTLIATEAQAVCRTTLPPASERAGKWQYHVIKGQHCWFGPVKTVRHTRPSQVKVKSRPDGFAGALASVPVIAFSDAPLASRPASDDEIMPHPA